MTIKLDPEILHGQPHIEGTRIGVAHVLTELATQDACHIVMRQYPHLSCMEVFEALAYACKVMENLPQIRAVLPEWEWDEDREGD